MSGYVKIFRKITDWEWYKDPATRSVFLHLLFIANWKDGKYKGVDVPRGAAVVSVVKMAEDLGFSRQQTRTALSHLQSTNEITIKGYSKFSVITLNNYSDYQNDNQEDNLHLTINQPSTNHQLTTSEESKNRRIEEYKNNNLNNINNLNIYTTSSCSEPKAVSEPEPEAPVELLPLNDGSGWRPSMSLYEEYIRLYPNVDIEKQFRAMKAWCLSNPQKLKTKNGIKRFVGSWLSKEQDRPTARSGTGKNPFQDSYDMMREWAEGG